jgi:hypothetical protein
MRRLQPFTLLVLMLLATLAVAQNDSPGRDRTREMLRNTLDLTGPAVNMTFHQSEREPYNFAGLLSTGLNNADSFEVVISVSAKDTIHVRAYPHYHNHYINLDNVRDKQGLMRKLLGWGDTNFMYWGADSSGDIFAAYNFTLESGYPDNAMKVILYSIKPLDQYVGEMRPYVDGGSPQ